MNSLNATQNPVTNPPTTPVQPVEIPSPEVPFHSPVEQPIHRPIPEQPMHAPIPPADPEIPE